MWWDIAPEVRSDFERWHAHEHFPERLAIPGFLRASRWRSSDGGDGTFVLYELADHDVVFLSGLVECADPLVDQADAASPQHGPQPVPCARKPRRRHCLQRSHRPSCAGRRT
jgi:hypothetical protein